MVEGTKEPKGMIYQVHNEFCGYVNRAPDSQFNVRLSRSFVTSAPTFLIIGNKCELYQKGLKVGSRVDVVFDNMYHIKEVWGFDGEPVQII